MVRREAETLSQWISRKLRTRANRVRKLGRALIKYSCRYFYFGKRYRCNCCGSNLPAFFKHSPAGNMDNTCPCCLAVERQRFALQAFQVLSRNGQLNLKGNALHVAPERSLGKYLRTVSEYYIPVDLSQSKSSYMPLKCRADLTNLPFCDDSVDYVVCSHVLEHIPNDRRAMSELARVLKPAGWAFLPVPLRGGETDEDPAVTDPRERTRRFGRRDHVRYYGRVDYLHRLSAAGLEPAVIPRDRIVSEAEARVLGISDRFADTRHVWLFRKPGHLPPVGPP